MFRLSAALLIVAQIAAISGCGFGSDNPSEGEAKELIQAHTNLYSVECVKSTGADRDFDCTGEVNGDPVTIKATVAESGEAVVITHCTDNASRTWGDPCAEVR